MNFIKLLLTVYAKNCSKSVFVNSEQIKSTIFCCPLTKMPALMECLKKVFLNIDLKNFPLEVIHQY